MLSWLEPCSARNHINGCAVLLIWAVRSFINGYNLTVINSLVHQNSYLDFPTAVVISLSRCDFPAVISAQKISAETVRPFGTWHVTYLQVAIIFYWDQGRIYSVSGAAALSRLWKPVSNLCKWSCSACITDTHKNYPKNSPAIPFSSFRLLLKYTY
jgi:hypothetical protein